MLETHPSAVKGNPVVSRAGTCGDPRPPKTTPIPIHLLAGGLARRYRRQSRKSAISNPVNLELLEPGNQTPKRNP